MRANYSLITTLPTLFAVEGDLAGEEVVLLAERLWPHVLTGPPDTLVDLAQASTIDTAGVDLLVAAHSYAAHRCIPLRIVNAAPRVLRVLQAAGVHALPPRGRRPDCAAAKTTTPAPRQHNAAVMA
ncbi:STAS domain-containing protein [Saccharopolyspora sp. TS4A08]|uniref:STAS domain-containing protein n=1 Tax=Saccharopolyspora ipomoeae TaxID=3042027 RepID=A0ABT6PT10_9PSEU|nr:STAS domain-containing protein [Saccharopolyspora sp. TS4A08]MDI2031144.1 STAS domain-containing protein [Saccharopolyspora sp. TS4A08]